MNPYRNEPPTNVTEETHKNLWDRFKTMCKSHPRNGFLYGGDSGTRVRAVFVPVAEALVAISGQLQALNRRIEALEQAKKDGGK